MKHHQPHFGVGPWGLALVALLCFGGPLRAQQRSTSNYLNATEIGEAIISSDAETRKLIVVTDDETALQIGTIVTNLDRAAPQVLINVVFLEVTYRKGMDIGVEGSFTRQSGDTTGTILQQFSGLPGLSSGSGIAAFAGEDWTVVLRAIAEDGRLQVLSRPTILARNNQQAVITVGQQVPLITGVNYDTFGNQRNAIEYQDVGIILTVTPFITSEDLIEMVVSPEISQLSDQQVPISVTGTNSVGAPVINRRAADTVVVTPDGHTVVIGGLMQNTKTEAVSKVPVLGDIPILGAAFRRKVTQDQKTELLIFLTPRIVKHPRDLLAMAQKQRADSVILPKAYSEEDLDRIFDGLPIKDTPPTKAKKSRKQPTTPPPTPEPVP
jgi:general secretion pathway protein D